jgi:hypothetical protein
VLATLVACESLQGALRAKAAPSVEQLIGGLRHLPGLFDVYVDDARGRCLLLLPAEIDASGDSGHFSEGPRAGVLAECLYVEGLTTGLGSNEVGLDRGQLGPTRVVQLREMGGKLLVEEVNLAYRATSANESERRAARESFASSVLWAGEVLARNDEGRALVDFTSFAVRDAHGVSATLRSSGQGEFRLDSERSALDATACLAFPDNLEFEALLTFEGARPGPLVRQTAPTPEAITLTQHHSLLRLPDAGYEPRAHPPPTGGEGVAKQGNDPGREPPQRRAGRDRDPQQERDD